MWEALRSNGRDCSISFSQIAIFLPAADRSAAFCCDCSGANVALSTRCRERDLIRLGTAQPVTSTARLPTTSSHLPALNISPFNASLYRLSFVRLLLASRLLLQALLTTTCSAFRAILTALWRSAFVTLTTSFIQFSPHLHQSQPLPSAMARSRSGAPACSRNVSGYSRTGHGQEVNALLSSWPSSSTLPSSVC